MTTKHTLRWFVLWTSSIAWMQLLMWTPRFSADYYTSATTAMLSTTGKAHVAPVAPAITDGTLPRSHRPTQKIRVLMGIFTADFSQEEIYRKRHRDLFALWNDTRVCTLFEFRNMTDGNRERCELIYTFVMGRSTHFVVSNSTDPLLVNETGNSTTSVITTQLVDDSIRPLEITSRPIGNTVGADVNNPDTIILNIQENMDDGKSPTWWYYASQIATQYDFDYVTKCDSDSILSLHDFFRHVYRNWAPAPYNSMTLIGVPTNKDRWPHIKDRKEREARYRAQETYFVTYYNYVHIYCSGQLYTMSTDLARAVADEARRLQNSADGGSGSGSNNNCPYCGHYEDHDISTMAYHATGPFVSPDQPDKKMKRQSADSSISENDAHSPNVTDPQPIKLIMMGSHHKYWQHDVKKDDAPFQRIWAREQARMAGHLFENQILALTMPRQVQ